MVLDVEKGTSPDAVEQQITQHRRRKSAANNTQKGLCCNKAMMGSVAFIACGAPNDPGEDIQIQIS